MIYLVDSELYQSYLACPARDRAWKEDCQRDRAEGLRFALELENDKNFGTRS